MGPALAHEILALEKGSGTRAKKGGSPHAMKATVLLFHDVVPPGGFDLSGFQSPDANIYKIDCAAFERHLAAMSECAPEPPGVVFDQQATRARRLLITFDDGGVSAATFIADMLDSRRWPGHFLVTTDFIGTPGFVRASHIRELHSRGHVIGSHSCSHPLRMAACSATQLDREWRESVERLQDILGSPIEVASIPGGYYGTNVAAAAATAGIRHLFTSEPVISVRTVDGCRIYGRFSVHQGVRPEWVGSVIAGDVWPRVQSLLFWNAKKILKKAGGTAWIDARRRIIAARSR
jgi:peptidoglycan/xylan/chitin deacetylase (PgdA/CDA1 family)